MKKLTCTLVSFGTALCLCLLTLAESADAALNYWDPQTNSGTIPYTGNMSGVWENAVWSTSTNGQASTVNWSEAGVAAVFGVHTATNTPPFTVTANANHTIAGIFNAQGTGNAPCTVIINGTGTLTFSGVQGFSTGANGLTTISNVLAGTGQLVAESSGQLFLNGTNTYSGGTQLGFSGNNFVGIVNFNNSNSFGTGRITMFNAGGALVAEGTSAITITNAFTATNGALNIVGNPAGVTFSGPMNLGANAFNIGTGVAGNLVVFSGVISGSGSLNKFNPATLRLGGANTFSGGLSVSNGTLQLGVNGAIPSGSGKGNVSVVSPGILDVHGVSSSANGVSGTGTIDNTTGTGTLSVGNNNQTSEFDGTIQNSAGTLNITKAGTGTFTVNGVNTYSGATAINGGIFQLASSTSIPSGTAVSIASNGILDLNHFGGITIGTLSGQGAVSNNDSILTVSANSSVGSTLLTYSCYSGAITNGSLFKTGTHSMALRGSNTYSSATTEIAGGILSVGAAPNRLPIDTTLQIDTGAIFQLDANSQSVATLTGSGNINIGTGKFILNSPGFNSFSGMLQDSEIGALPAPAGHGLRGFYYDNQDFSNLKVVRDDPNVNFSDFTSAAQLPAAIYPNTNNFSVRWLGQVQSLTAGTYTFTVASDDGSRLWVNGVPVIDSWVTQGGTARSGSIVLAANTRYDFVLEYFNQTGGASAKLSWTPPGDVSSIIPTDYLYLPAQGQFVTSGNGQLILTASNSYSGGTVVSNGTLEAQVQGGLGAGNVTVLSGATLQLDDGDTNGCIGTNADLLLSGANPTVNLNFSGSNFIHGLSLDGGVTYQPGGLYGPSGSGATYELAALKGSGLLVVTASPSTNVLTTSGTPVPYGSAVTFTSTITGGGATPTGTVTFFDGASSIGSAPLDGSGVAMLTVSDLLAVTSPHNINAVYNGDTNYTASTSGTVSQGVTPITVAPGAITLTISNKTYDATTSASIATSNFPIVGVLASDTNNVHMAASVAFADKTAGANKTVNVTLSLAGGLSGNYVLSPTTTNATATISNKNLTITNLAVNSKPFDGTTNATLNTASAALVGVIAGDVVTLNFAGAQAFFADASVGNGKAVTVSGLALASGDAGNYTFSNPALTGNITKGVSSVAIVSSQNPSLLNANVSFTATVSGLGGTPSGNVTFLTNSVALGAVTLNNGVAVTNTSGLPTGTNTVTVQYVGDNTYLGATNSISQVVSSAPPMLSITNAGTNVVLSWQGVFTLQSSSNIPGGFSDVTNATSPYTNPASSPAQFFRLRQ